MLLILFACASEPAPAPAPTPTASPAPAEAPKPATEAKAGRSIKAADLKADLDAKKVPVLVDVRSTGEFASGHVPGALNIPIDQLEGRVAELDAYKGAEVYLICQVGGRSARAQSLLGAKGFTTVNVSDGTAAWASGGFPVEK